MSFHLQLALISAISLESAERLGHKRLRTLMKRSSLWYLPGESNNSFSWILVAASFSQQRETGLFLFPILQRRRRKTILWLNISWSNLMTARTAGDRQESNRESATKVLLTETREYVSSKANYLRNRELTSGLA